MSHPTQRKARAGRGLTLGVGIALSILGVAPSASAGPNEQEQPVAAPTDEQVRTRIRNLNRWLADQPFVTAGTGFGGSWLEIDGASLLVHHWSPDLEVGSGRANIAPVLAIDPKLPEIRPGLNPRNPFVHCRSEPPISEQGQECWSFERSPTAPINITMVTFDADEAIVDLVYRAIEDLIVMLQQRAVALR